MLCIWWRQVAKDASDRGPGTKDFVPGPRSCMRAINKPEMRPLIQGVGRAVLRKGAR